MGNIENEAMLIHLTIVLAFALGITIWMLLRAWTALEEQQKQTEYFRNEWIRLTKENVDMLNQKD